MWLLVNLVPFVGLLWVFVELALLPGNVGDNRYGPPPNEPKAPATMNEAAP